MGDLVKKMRRLGSARTPRKAAAARINGLKGGRPKLFKIGATVEIKPSKALIDKYTGRIGTILEIGIGSQEIIRFYQSKLWRTEIRGLRFRKVAEPYERTRITKCRNAVRVRFRNGDEAWFPRPQVHRASRALRHVDI